MNLKISCKTFSDLVTSTKELLTDVNLSVTAEGLTMQSMDTAHVALCMLNLPSACFTQFEVDETYVIGVNMGTLSMALNCLDLGAELLLQYVDDELHLSTDGDRGPRSLVLHTMEIGAEILDIPLSEPKGVVELDSRDFASLCLDSLKLGEDGCFNLKESTLEIETSGDLGAANFSIVANERNKVFNRGYDEKVRFNWKYLSSFSKAKVSAPRVQLHFVQGNPLKVLFQVAKGGTLVFYLAPRHDFQ